MNESKDGGKPEKGAPATEYERTAREADATLAKRKASDKAAHGQPETKEHRSAHSAACPPLYGRVGRTGEGATIRHSDHRPERASAHGMRR